MLRKILEYSLVALIISIITSIFTFPVFLNIKGSLYGDPEFHADPFGVLWWLWYQRDFLKGIFSPIFIDLVNYPFGLDYSSSLHQPLFDSILRFGGAFFNEIITYNLFIISGFIITGIISYLFFKYLVRDKPGALFGSIIFTFSVDHCMRSMQHMGFALLWWIPLLLLCVFRLKDKPGFIISVLTGMVLSCTIFASYYYGYFMLIFLFYMGIFYLPSMAKKGGDFVKSLFITLGIPFLIGLFIFKDFFFQKGSGSFMVIQPFKDLFKYSAHWWDYFVPSEFHPLFGKFTKKIVDTVGGRHYFERSLYLGYIPLFFSAIAIVKHGFGKKRDLNILFFLMCGIIFFIFSLTPIFQIGNIRIPNLSFFMYKLFPMFRVYARMGILVILSVAILAGFGLKQILDRVRNKWARAMVAGLCVVGVLFEYLNFPPFHNIDLSKTPKVYEWLARLPEKDKPPHPAPARRGWAHPCFARLSPMGRGINVVIVEYPFVRSIEALHSEYLFYQRVHKKALINGASEGTIGDAFRRQMQYPYSIESAKLLAYLGANYMIVHKDFYTEKDFKKIDKNIGLEFVKDFPDARVYRIVAKPDNLTVVFWKNFASWERWDDGKYWRWMGNNATIWTGNGPVKMQSAKCKVQNSKTVNVKFKILAFAKARELEVYVNDILINKIDVSAPSGPEYAQKVLLENVLLQPGENIIRFYTPQGEDRIGDVLHNDDNRKVSFAISGFEVKESDSK